MAYSVLVLILSVQVLDRQFRTLLPDGRGLEERPGDIVFHDDLFVIPFWVSDGGRFVYKAPECLERRRA